MSKVTYIISDIDKAVFFEHTAVRLREARIDISFILINSENSSLAAFLDRNNFKVSYLSVSKLLYSWQQILQCAAILRKEKPEVIHCHLGTANFVGLIAGYLSGVGKRIYTRHAGQPLHESRKERVIDRIQNRLATTIIAITENTKEILLSQGVRENKIKIVHHGFDLYRMMSPDQNEVARIISEYNATSKYPVVGVIARWMKWKGIQYIIPAFKELLKEYPDAKLCLFNASDNADYSVEIKSMLGELPSDSYQIVPFEKNIYDLYQLFDIYVHVPVNPYCEAFGQTYVEALAAGIPSIFTLSGVAREFISEDNAYIVEFENSAQILEKMKAVLTKQKDPEQLRKNGQAIVLEKFSLEAYISMLLEVYN